MQRKIRRSKAKVKPITMDFVRWGSSRPQRHDSAKLPQDSEERWFHTPPTVWGFYAFPRGFVCYDLLYTSNPSRLYKSNRLHWIKDTEGKRVKYDRSDMGAFWGKENQKRKRLRKINGLKSNNAIMTAWNDDGKNYGYVYTYGNPNKFKYSGNIWHHLEMFTYTVVKYDTDNCIHNDEKQTRRTKSIRLVDESEIIDRNGTWVKTSMRSYRNALKKYNNYLKYFGWMNVTVSNAIVNRRQKYSCLVEEINGEEYAYFEVYIEKL